MTKERRVVITGLGPLASMGIGKQAFWRNIIEGDVGLKYKEIRNDGELWDGFYYHEVKGFDIDSFNIEKNIIEDIRAWKMGCEDKALYYLIAAAKLALDDSKLSYDRDDNNIGIFVTVEHPGFEPFCESIIKETVSYLQSLPDINKFSDNKLYRHVFNELSQAGYDLQTFMYLFLVAKALGLHGYSLYNNNACASGLFAMESAARQIKYGSSDVVVIAGCDNVDSTFKHLWFKDRGLYAEDGKIKPFSKDADGLVLGDGASAIVMEEMQHAIGRNADIYAEYLGGGFALEGWKVVLPQIGSMSYQKSIETALRMSNLVPDDIDFINPHGVAIKATDAYEARAITDIFGKNTDRPIVSAFKPYVGHNLGGSAILESIILLLSMGEKCILPTLNCDEIEPKYNLAILKTMENFSLTTAMKLSCGFAGYNGAVVFKALN